MKNLLFILVLLLHGISYSQSRFSKVTWIVETTPGLTNEFSVTMVLTTHKGKKIMVLPGENPSRWAAFTFRSNDIQYFTKGKGRYIINRELTGKDSITVSAVSQELELNSSFKVPVIHCQGIRLDNQFVEYGSPQAQQWIMIMNDHSELPLQDKWFDTTVLRNASDPSLLFRNGQISVIGSKPLPHANVRFIHETTGKTIIDHAVRVTYAARYAFDFSGLDGRDGRKGTNGSQSAESGGNGENGEDGKAALPVVLFIRKTPVSDTFSLIEVIAISGSRKQRVFISAEHPGITVLATGGNGGHGGKGGKGSDATQTDKDSYNLQQGGNGGSGGFGGHGGDGGDVGIIVTEDVVDAESWVVVKNTGGANGNGGFYGDAGAGDNGSNGLLHALLTNNNGSSGAYGKAGYAGRDGSNLGVRSVADDEFKSLLVKAGWF